MRNFSLSFFSVLFILSLTSCDKVKSSFELIKADTAYNQGQFDKAIKIYERALEGNPQNGEVQWKLGIAYYSKGDRDSVKKQEMKLRKLGEEKLAQDLEQLLEQ